MLALLQRFRAARLALLREEELYQDVLESVAYRQCLKELDYWEQERLTLLQGLPSGQEEYDAALQALKQAMQERGLSQLEEFKATRRVKRTVDTRLVLETLGGDLDSLLLMVTIPIKNIEQFMRENRTMRKLLRPCIKIEGYQIIDLTVDQE